VSKAKERIAMFKVGSWVVAERYARVMAMSKDLERIEKGLMAVVEFLKDDNMKNFFANPVLPWWIKVGIWEKIASQNDVPEVLTRVISFMIKKNRLDLIERVMMIFRKLKNRKEGVVEVDVEVAMETPKELLDFLKKSLEKFFAKRVSMNVKVNPELIAGLRVRCEDKVWEMSVNAVLNEFVNRVVSE